MTGDSESLKFIWHDPDWDILNAMQDELAAKMPGLVKKYFHYALFNNGDLVDTETGDIIDRNIKNFYYIAGNVLGLTESGDIHLSRKEKPYGSVRFWIGVFAEITKYTDVRDISLSDDKKQAYVLHNDGRVSPVMCELDDDFKNDIEGIYLEGDVFQKRDGSFRSKTFPGIKEIKNVVSYSYDEHIFVLHASDGRCVSISGFSGSKIEAKIFENIKKYMIQNSYTVCCLDEEDNLYGKFYSFRNDTFSAVDFVLLPFRKEGAYVYSDDYVENGKLDLHSHGFELQIALLKKNGTIEIHTGEKTITINEPGAAALKFTDGDLYAVTGMPATRRKTGKKPSAAESVSGTEGNIIDLKVIPDESAFKSRDIFVTKGNKSFGYEITPDGRIKGVDNANVQKCVNAEKLWISRGSILVKFSDGTYAPFGEKKQKLIKLMPGLYGKEVKYFFFGKLFVLDDGTTIASMDDADKCLFWEQQVKNIIDADYKVVSTYDYNNHFALCEDGTVVSDLPKHKILFTDAEKLHCYFSFERSIICAECKDGTLKLRKLTSGRLSSVITLEKTDKVFIYPDHMYALYDNEITTFLGKDNTPDLIKNMNRQNPVDFIYDKKVIPPVYCVLNHEGILKRYKEPARIWEVLEKNVSEIKYKGNGVIEIFYR